MPAWPSTLPLPNRTGYALNPQTAFIRTTMASGKARQRRRFTDIPTRIPLTWLLTEAQLGIFEAWYKHEINLGAAYFDLTLWNGRGLNMYGVRFTDGYKIALASGKYFNLTAEVEVYGLQTMTKAQLTAYL